MNFEEIEECIEKMLQEYEETHGKYGNLQDMYRHVSKEIQKKLEEVGANAESKSFAVDFLGHKFKILEKEEEQEKIELKNKMAKFLKLYHFRKYASVDEFQEEAEKFMDNQLKNKNISKKEYEDAMRYINNFARITLESGNAKLSGEKIIELHENEIFEGYSKDQNQSNNKDGHNDVIQDDTENEK